MCSQAARQDAEVSRQKGDMGSFPAVPQLQRPTAVIGPNPGPAGEQDSLPALPLWLCRRLCVQELVQQLLEDFKYSPGTCAPTQD